MLDARRTCCARPTPASPTPRRTPSSPGGATASTASTPSTRTPMVAPAAACADDALCATRGRPTGAAHRPIRRARVLSTSGATAALTASIRRSVRNPRARRCRPGRCAVLPAPPGGRRERSRFSAATPSRRCDRRLAPADGVAEGRRRQPTRGDGHDHHRRRGGQRRDASARSAHRRGDPSRSGDRSRPRAVSTDRARFPTVALREPPKSDVLAFEDNGALDRQVEFVRPR